MTRFVHISQENPAVGRGGVAQFGRDLRLAIPGLEFMYGGSDWAIAEANNIERLERGDLDQNSVVIADGYYGGGLGSKVKELIVVAHGTYGGWLRDVQRRWLPEFESSIPILLDKAKAQEKVFREADRVVAVSTLAQEELWTIHRVESEVAFLGVDTSEFRPRDVEFSDGAKPSIVTVAIGDKLKGEDIIAGIKSNDALLGEMIRTLGFDGKKSDRWRASDSVVALLPTRHEGGGYALLEAMATNLAIVSGRTGYLVHDVPGMLVYDTDDYYWGTFARLLRDAMEHNYQSTAVRDWVLENATIELFCKRWKGVLGL